MGCASSKAAPETDSARAPAAPGAQPASASPVDHPREASVPPADPKPAPVPSVEAKPVAPVRVQSVAPAEPQPTPAEETGAAQHGHEPVALPGQPSATMPPEEILPSVIRLPSGNPGPSLESLRISDPNKALGCVARSLFKGCPDGIVACVPGDSSAQIELVSNGRTIATDLAALRFMCRRYRCDLRPDDAVVDNALCRIHYRIDRAIDDIIREGFDDPVHSASFYASVCRLSTKSIREELATLDEEIGDAFVCGPTVSLADFVAAASIDRLVVLTGILPSLLASCKSISSWRERVPMERSIEPSPVLILSTDWGSRVIRSWREYCSVSLPTVFTDSAYSLDVDLHVPSSNGPLLCLRNNDVVLAQVREPAAVLRYLVARKLKGCNAMPDARRLAEDDEVITAVVCRLIPLLEVAMEPRPWPARFVQRATSELRELITWFNTNRIGQTLSAGLLYLDRALASLPTAEVTLHSRVSRRLRHQVAFEIPLLYPAVRVWRCTSCGNRSCINSDACAILTFCHYFNISVNVVIELTKSPSGSLVELTLDDVRITEAPAIMRYLSRADEQQNDPGLTSNSFHCGKVRQDDALTWSSQRLATTIFDWRHGRQFVSIFETCIDELGEPPTHPATSALTMDAVYSASMCWVLAADKTFTDVPASARQRVLQWGRLLPIRYAHGIAVTST
ncbi:GST C-terminal domain-containing protein [Plasmodiophora brassicae]